MKNENQTSKAHDEGTASFHFVGLTDGIGFASDNRIRADAVAAALEDVSVCYQQVVISEMVSNKFLPLKLDRIDDFVIFVIVRD